MKRNQWPNPLLFDPRHIEFDRGWEFIMKGIRKLKKMIEEGSEPRFTAEEYITMYTVVYNMCVHRRGYSQQLYAKYKETCEDFYRVTSEDYNALTYQPDDFILRDLVKRWGRHKVIVRVLPGIFQYLDRYFIPSKSLPRLNEVVGVNSFCESVYRKVSSKARDAIIRLIDKERKGEKIDKELVKNVINVFVGVGMGQVDAYEKDFEAVMLKATGEYYSSIALIWILEDYSDTEYVSKAEECLQIERDRASYYLHSSSEQKLLQKVQHVLFEPLCNKFKLKVITEGATLVQVAAKNKASSDGAGLLEQVLVRNLIKLHEDHTAYVDHCFKNYPQFRKALREAFEVFCNKAVGDSSTAEILAAFCDNLLKRGENLMSDQEIQETLEKLVKKLLPCLSDKDLFAKFYRKRLACRLLFDRCLSKDHEENILATMKQQCGAPFTSKMEGMITDVTLARDNQTSFQEYLQSNPSVNHPGMDLTATILTTGFWPSYKSLEVNLPAEMVKCMEVYKGFYETKTRNRKLTWIYSLGSCNIVGNFEPKKIELVVSTCQAALLLLFNTADRLSYSEIATQSNLNHDDLVRILRSLSCAQYNILIKETNTNSILPNDNFEFNSKFTHRMRRIKIPLPPVVDERKEVLNDVGKDRRYAIDAAIVRIMKSQKILNYQQLVADCVEQLRHIFKPDIRAIKKRIEDLISRDYLERDKENLNLLKYLV